MALYPSRNPILIENPIYGVLQIFSLAAYEIVYFRRRKYPTQPQIEFSLKGLGI
jgi:hypothetical protein